jgi:hypothetical protein
MTLWGIDLLFDLWAWIQLLLPSEEDVISPGLPSHPDPTGSWNLQLPWQDFDMNSFIIGLSYALLHLPHLGLSGCLFLLILPEKRFEFGMIS